MDKDATFFWDLTARHLAGTTTPEEEQLLAAWLQENPEQKQAFEEQRRLWQLSEKQPKNAFSPEEGWQEFLQRVQAEKQANAAETVSPAFPWMRVAAGLALLLVSVFLIRYFLFPPVQTVTLAATDAKRLFTLPDSSQVWLNKGSSLTYQSDFGEEDRPVTLQGEGYFEVQHNAHKPFLVTTSGTETQVLGTTFQVSTQDSAQVEVVLFTGKVAFRAKTGQKQEVTLAPGQKAVYSATTGQIETAFNQDQNELAWKEDRFQFQNTPLEQVALTLNAYYGVSITFEKPVLAQCHFTGSFRDAPALEEVLVVLTKSLQLSYNEVQPNVFRLSGEGCR
ncbi:FecR domain-containing protein [Sabulibacter ruber]|uniref:FecR domain-containing protein n=1 Tax=Sabulibacter ruber TaxID=2811901 RepID=UPI001A97A84E|nr:FecR domain-containing protein [Sabulibacter ruber]